MRGCKGRKLGCVNGCVRLDCIFFVSFLCVFFIFNLVFQTLRRKSRLKSFGLSCLHCFMALTDTQCMLYIFSFSTRQDPCALALLGEFRTKHCMLSNHETILCMYIHIYSIHIPSQIYILSFLYIYTYVWINMTDDGVFFLCTWYEQFCNQAG